MSRTGIVAGTFIWLFLTTIFARSAYLSVKLDRPTSIAVYDSNSRLLNLRLSQDQSWRLPPPNHAAMNRWEQGVLCIEDQYFYSHPGVNLFAMMRAGGQLLTKGRLISGASTIPMQLARMIHRLPRRAESKLIESLDALVMSLFHSKQSLIRTYAQLAPMGGNIEGAETAARAYFQRSLDELTWRELSVLLILPQSPSRLVKWNDANWMNASASTLRRLNGCGVIDAAQLEAALKQEIRSPRSHRFPVLAQHVSDYLARQSASSSEIHSNLDFSIQQQLHSLVSRQRESFFAKDIQNIAIAVAEIKTGKLRGLIGNFDYNLDHSEQKIASFDVLRSPGSTLKPLIFGLAIDDQVVLPDTLIEDIPSRYGTYQPSNFDSQFSGLVKAKTALSKSLNIPFIELLAKLGLERMTNAMSKAGLVRRTPDSLLGLSMAVGGIDVRFLDLVELYTGLANQGHSRKLRLLHASDIEREDSQEFLSEAAAYLTTEALKQRDRPEADALVQALGLNSSIAWKTGTSQDRLDAWSIGFDEKHVVAVWLGNLNRMSSRYLVGTEAAAPVMFDIFAMLLPSDQRHHQMNVPISVSEIEVCALSGMLPGPACDERVQVPSANGKIPPHRCKYHRHAIIDRSNGLEVSMSCANHRNIERRSVTSVPRPIRRWLGNAWSSTLDSRFAADPSCPPEIETSSKFQIESPRLHARFSLLPSSQSELLTLPFRVSGASANEPLICYIDGIRKTLNSQDVLMMNEGRHEIYCSDRRGEAAKTVFWIDRPQIAMLGDDRL
jgi:penicillin-binding protein 1C